MLTRPVVVAQTDLFLRQASELWTEDEHEAFVNFIAMHADVGEVIPGLGGIRKSGGSVKEWANAAGRG